MAKSLAFWIEQGNNSNNESASYVDLHINYWLLNQDKKDEINYLDFGVKFANINLENDSSINVYLPFKINKEDYISNLGDFVCKNTDLIQTIFNSRHKATNHISNTAVEIQFNEDDSLIVHTQIELDSKNGGVQLHNTDNGCILSFPGRLFCDAKNSPKPSYFRFRIKLNNKVDKKSFSQSYKHSDRFILSRLESTEIVDFRINEVRDLPGIIQTKELDNSMIKKIHFFLIREVDSEFKQAHANFYRCRLLEKELWKGYLELNSNSDLKLPKQMLIYHWKESAKSENENNNQTSRYIEKFTAFAKFSKITVSRTTIIYFVIAAILIGLIASLIGEIINEKIITSLLEVWSYLQIVFNIHF